MLLVIDNYDSFTYNLVQYLGELGAEVIVRRNDAVTVEEIGTLAPAGIRKETFRSTCISAVYPKLTLRNSIAPVARSICCCATASTPTRTCARC